MPHLVILYSGNLDAHTDMSRLCRNLAVHAILDDLVVHVGGLVHRRKERNVPPEFEPLSSQITIGNDKLPLQHFFVIVNLRILLEQLLILLERALVVAFCFIATTKQILSAWSVVGKRPRSNRSTSGFESKAVIPLIDSFLRDLLLVLGPRPGPFAAPNGFVGPTLAGPINQRGRDSQRQRD